MIRAPAVDAEPRSGVRRLQGGEVVGGVGGVAAGVDERVADGGRVGPDDVAGRQALGVVEGAAQQVLELVAPRAGEGPQDRQRVGALDHVVAAGLAEVVVAGHDVEQVVDDLEGDAVGPPERGEGVDLVAGELGHEGPDAARRGEQGRGLALDGAVVALFGAGDVEGVLELGDLALAEAGDGGGQQRGHLRAEAGRDLRRLRQQVVAGEDGLEVAPPGVDALDEVPGGGLVHDVVVVQRAQVHQLAAHPAHHRLGRHGLGAGGGGERGGHGERRPLALAAGLDEVGGDLREEGVVGGDGLQQGVVHPTEAVGQCGGRRRRTGHGSHGPQAR